jgi:hypothetical protein
MTLPQQRKLPTVGDKELLLCEHNGPWRVLTAPYGVVPPGPLSSTLISSPGAFFLKQQRTTRHNMETQSPHVIRPKAFTTIELCRVGVIFSRSDQLLKCVRCEAEWRMKAWFHMRPAKYWVCPNGCNAPS